MYLIEGLSFQEQYFEFIERRYNITLHRVPHWYLSGLFRNATYMPHNINAMNCRQIKQIDIETEIRRITGIEWITWGHKMVDSLERRGRLSVCKGIDTKTKRVYPLALWKDSTVFNYLKANHIPLPPDYNLFHYSRNTSFGGLFGQELKVVKEKFPQDYKKILTMFPFAEAATKQYECYNEVSEI